MRTKIFLLFVISFFLFLDSPAQVNLNNGLVLYLPFSGNANDASSYGNHGVVNGATLTADRWGNPNSAYDFDGVDDYIEVPNSTSLAGLTSYSICAYVKTDRFNRNPCFGNMIFTKGKDHEFGRLNIVYHPNEFYNMSCIHPMDSTRELYHFWYHNFAFPIQGVTGLPNQPYIDEGKWDCVILTYDSALSNIKLYVNGEKYVDTTLVYLGAYNDVDPIFIGKNDEPSYSYNVDGQIDEIRLYNRALNLDEVKAYCEIYPEEVNDLESAMHVNIYPNPTNGNLTLNLRTDDITKRISVKIYNMLGQMVLSREYENSTELVEDYPTENLAPGTYELVIEADGILKTLKFVRE